MEAKLKQVAREEEKKVHKLVKSILTTINILSEEFADELGGVALTTSLPPYGGLVVLVPKDIADRVGITSEEDIDKVAERLADDEWFKEWAENFLDGEANERIRKLLALKLLSRR